MLLDQPIPHQFVVLLVPDALAVRPGGHDDRHQGSSIWPVNISAKYYSIIHPDRQVAFDNRLLLGDPGQRSLHPAPSTTGACNAEASRRYLLEVLRSASALRPTAPLLARCRRTAGGVAGTARCRTGRDACAGRTDVLSH